jgi:hypothetical protein
MKNSVIIVIAALVILIGGYLVFRNTSTDTNINTDDNTEVVDTNTNTDTNTNPTAETQSDIVVTTPKSGQSISSPISVSGKARGSWFFEASAPVEIQDNAGHVLGQGHIQAQGEWMTTDFVPFTGSIAYTAGATTTSGFVVFKNDNPSGDPSRDKVLSIPVVFKK